MKSETFYAVIVCFFLGVVFQVFYPLGIFFAYFLFLLCGALILYGLLFSSDGVRGFLFVSLCLAGLGVGVLRVGFPDSASDMFLASRLPAEVTMTGTIVSEPDRRAENTELRVRIGHIHFKKTKETFSLKDKKVRTLLFASRYKNFEYGEKIMVEGTLERPENFKTGSGRTFDYVHYLGKDDIHAIMFYPKVDHLSYGHGFVLKAFLFDIKHTFLESIARLFPEPQSSLLGGLLVGAKQSLGDAWLQKFRTAGVVHIIVLSGYNVTLVAYFIMAIFTRLRFKPKTAGVFGGVGILLFMVLVGAGATVVRASFMALLVVFARTTGRTGDMVRFLFFVGAGMVLWNPQVLLYSPSFQLSFLATLGLLLFSPIVYRWLTFIPEKFLLREVASATIATQIFVLPFILHMVGYMSLVAVPVNLFVLAVIPFTMFFGFVAGVFGLFSTLLALPFAYVAYLLLSYVLFVVDLASGFAFAKIAVPQFPFWIVLLVYVFYGALLFRYRYLLKMPNEHGGALREKTWG